MLTGDVIKSSPSWTADNLRCVLATLEACEDYADQQGIAPFVAHAYAVSNELDALCTDWVEGVEMRDWLAERWNRLPESERVDDFLESTRMAGALLARYHAAVERTLDLDLPWKASTLEPAGLNAKIVRTLAGRRRYDAARRVRSFDDPGPHNAIVVGEGSLCLIDLPAHVQVVSVERDIAKLASRHVGVLQRATRSFWWPRVDHYRAVVHAASEGYAEAAGTGETVDEALMMASLAADATMKSVLTRRRRPKGSKMLEPFVRETLSAVLVSGISLVLRLRTRRP